jgi:hypothetical protein
MQPGWVQVPAIGTIVTADHVQSVANPDEYFAVREVRVESGKAYARGSRTIWFNVKMLTSAPPDWVPPLNFNED